MDQIEFAEDHVTSNFLKAVLRKSYLVHSWIPRRPLCSSELAQLVPLSFSWGRSTCYSDRLHDFSVTRCYKDVYVNSFFPPTARRWNSLPIECFPLTYDLSGFKGCVRYIFASLFLSLNKKIVKLGKMFFIWLQKHISFSRKSNFRILNLQISWRHQMPKHKTRNTFH